MYITYYIMYKVRIFMHLHKNAQNVEPFIE